MVLSRVGSGAGFARTVGGPQASGLEETAPERSMHLRKEPAGGCHPHRSTNDADEAPHTVGRRPARFTCCRCKAWPYCAAERGPARILSLRIISGGRFLAD